MHCSQAIQYPQQRCEELAGPWLSESTVEHLSNVAAVLGIYALVCLTFVLIHRAVFDLDDDTASSNTLFDFVSTIGG